MEESSTKKLKLSPEHEALKNHPLVQDSIKCSRRAVVTMKKACFKEREATDKNVEYEKTIDILKSEIKEMSCHHDAELKVLQDKLETQEVESHEILLQETRIKLLQNQLEKSTNERKQILNENLLFKKEICDLRKQPISVVPLPRSDSIAYPAIDNSDAVISVSNLLSELLLFSATANKITETNNNEIISHVCTVVTKLVSGTKEQVNRALYLLAKAFYSNKAKNELGSLYKGDRLDKLLKPSEFAVICGCENTMRQIPPLAEILKIFCTKLEFQLLTDGQLSHCRVYAAVCQLLNDTDAPFRICKELLLRKEKHALIFIATIGSVYPDALFSHFKPDEQMDTTTRIFYHFILSKPKTMRQVKQCHRIFTTRCHLPHSSPFNFQDIIEDVLQALVKHFISEPSGDLPDFTSVKLIVLQMGSLWSISNIMYPLLEKLKSKEMDFPKEISQITKICTGFE